MPVVGHQTVPRYADGRSHVRFVKNFLKGKIISAFLEQPQATDTTV
jgi:hypothetical protein